MYSNRWKIYSSHRYIPIDEGCILIGGRYILTTGIFRSTRDVPLNKRCIPIERYIPIDRRYILATGRYIPIDRYILIERYILATGRYILINGRYILIDG